MRQNRQTLLNRSVGIIAGLLALSVQIGFAQDAGKPLDPGTMSWPRMFSATDHQFALYQPQIESWKGNQIEGQFAVGVRTATATNSAYGVVFFRARTEVDKANRLVTLEDVTITKLSFPTEKGLDKGLAEALKSQLPSKSKTIPLDHLESVFVVSQDAAKAIAVQVKNDPPRIIYTTQPALLVLVDGPPVAKPLRGDYQRIVNTRSILLEKTTAHAYYLYAAQKWFTASGLEGPWAVATNPPQDLQGALDAALATHQVDPMQPQQPLTTPPAMYVSTTPAELIQTTGQANLVPVDGTKLLYVANSDQAVFYDTADNNYYVLISGRWFKATSFQGSWTFVLPKDLPSDFKKIPPDHPKSNVLASVPGTPQANEAVIASSIPQTATIDASQAKLSVVYQGPPAFAPIEETQLAYATNTATPVIRLSASSYYACQGGVWFLAPSPTGPWSVATSVPAAIYTIPSTCPIHYVVYAYVYGSSGGNVQVGYTPGYSGVYVAPDGVVVYGTGYSYPPAMIADYWVPYPVTYGYGWGMSVGAFSGFAFGFAAGAAMGCWCEPYWGPYGWGGASGYSYSHVNANCANYYTHWGTAVHATSTSGFNAYTGREWAGQRATTYNPYTGAHGAAERGAVGNVYNGNYAAGRQGADYNPTTGRYGAAQKGVEGNAYAGTASSVDRGVVGDTKTGNAVAWDNGHVYADHDGNVYRANPAGGFEKYGGSSGWQSASSRESSWADQQRSARDMGAQRFGGFQRMGGGGFGGFRGGGRR